MFYVYVLQSCLNLGFYVGSTNDLKDRFKKHNEGKVFSTKRYKPWMLVYYEAYTDEKLARMREQKLKYHGNAWKQLKQRIIKGVKNGAGFTLIELLVVSGIFIIITTIVVYILFTMLRGTRNTDSIIIVRQNGEQAMAQMVRIMRFAKSLDDPCPLTDPKSVTITAADIAQTVYTFTCPAAFTPPNFIGLNGTKLTNDATTVVVDQCSFVCTQAGGSLTIGISFTLARRNIGGLPEGNAKIPFKSSVTLRNIGGQ